MVLDGQDLLGREWIPDADSPVTTDRDQREAVRAEGEPVHFAGVARHGGTSPSLLDVPQHDAAIAMGRGQRAAIGGGRHAVNRSICLPDRSDFAAGHVPERGSSYPRLR